MKKLFLGFMALMVFAGFQSVSAQDMSGSKMNGNMMTMSKKKNIVENAMASPDHTTLVAAVKAGGLVETLQGKGPFTVFAPTNSAFNALPAGTVDNLMKPESQMMLANVLKYHVVAGKMDSKAIMKAIKKGNGSATLTTVEGSMLMAKMEGNTLVLTDEKGGMSRVTMADMKSSNGVTHAVDMVLMPN